MLQKFYWTCLNNSAKDYSLLDQCCARLLRWKRPELTDWKGAFTTATYFYGVLYSIHTRLESDFLPSYAAGRPTTLIDGRK